MPNLGAIPKASTVGFRYGISRAVAKKKITTQRTEIGRVKALAILGKNSRIGGAYRDVRSFLTKNSFARYNGDVDEFLASIAKRKRLDFLLVIALGKIYNNLKCDYREPDLANLVFFGRLEEFARQMEKLTGKKTSISIAVENTFFDRHILRVNNSRYTKMTLNMSKWLVSEFGLKHLKVYPIGKFLTGKEYESDFYESVSDLNRKRASIKDLAEFKTFFNVFYESYPTKSFKSALALYTNKRGRSNVAKWAADSTIRYIAFFRARDKMDFWGYNGSYVRTSVSPRNGVLQFEYGVGRMSPLHGMGTLQNGKVGTERFYDVIKALPNASTLKLWYYKGKPFCADINGIKF